MTTTNPRRGPATPPPVAGPSHARPGTVYGYDLIDPRTGQIHTNDYVGQARDPGRRDRQHRGQIPQRDGQVREQPWSDLIAGGMRILEQGMWTDAELDERERYWIVACRPRTNCLDNPNPDRIPIYEQRRQRDLRDAARGLPARDWQRAPVGAPANVSASRSAGTDVAIRVLSSRWTWWALAYLATVTGCWWLLGGLGLDLGWRGHLGAAAVLPPLAAGGIYWWWRTTGRRRWRRIWR